ncbi:MAG: NUDIX hydrolase [Anaerotignum sp.]|nr:NUDIX hydrolase [Anaerotignum sp.]MDY3926609.1 NUDIX hydrolase [Anaerotignum sp.]
MSYEVLESKVTHEGKIVKITVDKLRMPDGSEAYRETVIRGKNAAAVLAVDNDGSLIFVRQYRHAFGEMLLEIPAGVLEDGEEPEEGVLRELEEETGKKAETLEFLCEMYPTVGYCTEKIQLFIATDLTEGQQKLDADEFLEIEKYTPEEAVEMIYKGQIKDGKTIAAIFAWMARKEA